MMMDDSKRVQRHCIDCIFERVIFMDKSFDRSIDNCYFVKTVLMMAVVFYHSCLYMVSAWMPIEVSEKSAVLLSVAGWFSTFHIYAFTLVSGYIFAYLVYEKGKYKQYKDLIIRKIKRLVIPAIFIACTWAATIARFVFGYDLKTLVFNYLFAISPNQLWFLWMLFWVFIFAWPVSKMQKTIYAGIIAILLLVFGYLGERTIPNYFQFWTGCEYFLFFWLGWTVRKHFREFVGSGKASIVLVVIDVVLFISSRNIYGTSFIIRLISFGINLLLHIVGAAMAFCILQYVAYKVNEIRVWSVLCKNTMAIFLFHQQIIYYLVILLLPYVVNPYIQVAINFLGSIILSFLLGMVLSKWKVTRILVGG